MLGRGTRQPLLGDQFEDDASAVVEYVHFSGGVLAERWDEARYNPPQRKGCACHQPLTPGNCEL